MSGDKKISQLEILGSKPADGDLFPFYNLESGKTMAVSYTQIGPTINYLNVTPSDEVTSTSLVLIESIPLEQKLMESNLKALLTLSIRTIQVTTNLTNTRVEVYLRGETEPNPVLLASAQTNAASRQWMDFEREIIIINGNLVLPTPTAVLISNKGTMLNELTEQIPIFNDDAHYLDIFIRRTGTTGTPGTVQKLSTKLTLEKQKL
jgi:hypothetical protein